MSLANISPMQIKYYNDFLICTYDTYQHNVIVTSDNANITINNHYKYKCNIYQAIYIYIAHSPFPSDLMFCFEKEF